MDAMHVGWAVTLVGCIPSRETATAAKTAQTGLALTCAASATTEAFTSLGGSISSTPQVLHTSTLLAYTPHVAARVRIIVPANGATQQLVLRVKAGRAVAMHAPVSMSIPVCSQHVLAHFSGCAPVMLRQAKDACVACYAEHKMGLVNPQPTVFHIFQVRTLFAPLACCSPLHCSRNTGISV